MIARTAWLIAARAAGVVYLQPHIPHTWAPHLQNINATLSWYIFCVSWWVTPKTPNMSAAHKSACLRWRRYHYSSGSTQHAYSPLFMQQPTCFLGQVLQTTWSLLQLHESGGIKVGACWVMHRTIMDLSWGVAWTTYLITIIDRTETQCDVVLCTAFYTVKHRASCASGPARGLHNKEVFQEVSMIFVGRDIYTSRSVCITMLLFFVHRWCISLTKSFMQSRNLATSRGSKETTTQSISKAIVVFL